MTKTMSSVYDVYGSNVLGSETPMQKSGRYAFMDGCESAIVPDLVAKLELSENDSFLEIGFGSGLLLEPLSKCVGLAHGVDHPNCAAYFDSEYPNSKVKLWGGNFLSMTLRPLGQFSKILIYGVLHCLQSREEVLDFVDRAVSLLEPGGSILLGDIPNISAKARFLASEKGAKIQRGWSIRVSEEGGMLPGSREEPIDTVIFDDSFICEILLKLRSDGYEAFLLPQGEELPFSHTREDVLVRSR